MAVSLTVPAKAPCEHPNLPPVPFDYEASKGMSAYEVRQRWPRKMQKCPDCGAEVICYASNSHYYSGDW
jgi:hypothetical protein